MISHVLLSNVHTPLQYPECTLENKHCFWLQDEMSGTVYAVKMNLRNLLAIAAERGCLALRKVDCGGDKQAEQEMLRLLSNLWDGQAPKVRAFKQVAMVEKQ